VFSLLFLSLPPSLPLFWFPHRCWYLPYVSQEPTHNDGHGVVWLQQVGRRVGFLFVSWANICWLLYIRSYVNQLEFEVSV
jgi:hypothetical protein